MHPISSSRQFIMTEEEFAEKDDSYSGLCLACGEEQTSGVGPDATNYKCEICGELQVFGVSELLIMGLITFE